MYAEAHIKGTLFVFNKIADQESETYLREELAKEGIKPLGVIREDKSISAAWLRGKPWICGQKPKRGKKSSRG